MITNVTTELTSCKHSILTRLGYFSFSSNFSTFFLTISPSELVSLIPVLTATLTEYRATVGHHKENPNTVGHKCSEKWQPKNIKVATVSSLYLTFEEVFLDKSRCSIPFTLIPSLYPFPETEESEGSN